MEISNEHKKLKDAIKNITDIDKEGQIILLDGEYNDIKIDYKAICDDCWRKIYGKGV